MKEISVALLYHQAFLRRDDAAVAIDSIMREHGLDESCMNFPKSVGSSSKAATDSKMTNFQVRIQIWQSLGWRKWINGTSLNTKAFFDDAKDAAVAIDKITRAWS